MPSASSVDRKPRVTEFTSAVASSEDVADGLDWQAFSAAYFPGRRRHDFEALTAYDAYKRSRAVDERSADAAARLEDAENTQSGLTALHAWEDEGGAGGADESQL